MIKLISIIAIIISFILSFLFWQLTGRNYDSVFALTNWVIATTAVIATICTFITLSLREKEETKKQVRIGLKRSKILDDANPNKKFRFDYIIYNRSGYEIYLTNIIDLTDNLFSKAFMLPFKSISKLPDEAYESLSFYWTPGHKKKSPSDIENTGLIGHDEFGMLSIYLSDEISLKQIQKSRHLGKLQFSIGDYHGEELEINLPGKHVA